MSKPFHTAFKFQDKSFCSVEEILNFSKNISEEVQSFLRDWFDEKSFIEVKTSGSTGKPKVIQLQKNHMINSALAMGEYFDLPEKTTALLCMSTSFIAGKMMLVRALVLGWHLDLVEPVSSPLKGNTKQYDFCAMVPLQLNNSITDIKRIKKLIVGGGIVSKELLEKVQKVKTEVFGTYGMTETITHIAVKRLNNLNTEASTSVYDFEVCHPELVEGETNHSYYQVLPNISISTDERNCLVIDAPKIASEKIITNDLVKLISSTEFNWLGRFDNIINSGGIKLVPEQIEEKLSTIISQRFFVAGIADAVLGEKLVLVVEELFTKRSSNFESEISTALNQRKNEIHEKLKSLQVLSKYEIPKAIYFVEIFIETPSGKVSRNETLKEIKRTC